MLSGNRLLGLTSLCAPSRREAGHTRAVEELAFQRGQDAPKQSPLCLCQSRDDVQVDPAETSSETTSAPVKLFFLMAQKPAPALRGSV